MTKLPAPNLEAAFIDAPRDPLLQMLHNYWDGLRRGRVMPARADIDATAIPKLLPYIILYNVGGRDQPFTIRLVGEEVRFFVGQNATGRPAGATMEPTAAETMIKILDAVVAARSPKFRAGKTQVAQGQELSRLRGVLPATLVRWRASGHHPRRRPVPGFGGIRRTRVSAHIRKFP